MHRNTRTYRRFLLLAVVTGLFALSGANCPFLWTDQDELTRVPPALGQSPNLDQVIQVVNAQTSQIQSFTAHQASISGQGFPSLRTSIAFERPRHFRLRAETGLTGPEIDLGSNEELFWFWVRRNQPAATYYCRHEQFATCPARNQLPVDPEWLVEAFGVMQFDPTQHHQGPYPAPGGRLEIRSTRDTPEGPALKSTFVDGVHGVVLEQRVFDARGQLIARAAASHFRRDPANGIFMPTLIDIQSPPNKFTMQINLGTVEINRPITNGGQLWAMPSYPGFPAVDLCNPSQPGPPGAPAVTSRPYAPNPIRNQRTY
jgi:hypothetical protein